VDFVGSDLHHLRHLNNIKAVKKSLLYNKIFKKNIILNNTLIDT